ncbi:MAG: type II toxin-antitoxin system VapC family toxin [Bdellovibrio sp.]
MKNNGLLLDTHAWIWLALGDEKMAKGISKKIIEKSFRESKLFVSAISLWEIGMLEAKGRVVFSEPCLDWIELSMKRLRLEVIPLSAEIAVEATRLPGGFRGNPADRIIVASCRKERLSLVTQDKLILSYGQQGLLRAIPCY